MNQSKFIFSAAKILFVSLFFLSVSFAQNDIAPTPKSEPSYDVILQILVASNSGGEKSALPTSLANIVKKLKTNYPQANFNLTGTYLQRVANTGSMEFKSISGQTGKNFEWTLSQLKKASNFLQIRRFNFVQRIPVGNAVLKDENGNTSSITTYDTISLAMQELGFGENVPAIVGSLSASKPDEIMFLILTIKPSEN